MQRRFITLMTGLVLTLLLSTAAIAQTAQFNPRDLSGIWVIRGHRSISANVPPMTPEGQRRLDANKPTRGRYLGEPLNGEHPGFVRATRMPSEGNDPAHLCNPNGFPRLLLDPEPVEFVNVGSDRFMQFFQWERQFREIWLDGREIPSGRNLEDLGPAWYGHSAGRWEANTLVINTVGIDDRSWIDIYGFPRSFQARIEERYTRTGPDTIELRMTMYDPAFYTAPWVSDVKTFRRQPPDSYTYSGWKSLFSGVTEGICAPVNEVESYNTRFRDPAVGLR
jgi:hypothetical protein